ncbi:STAS domain-containing protein [uncultured Rhodoblastus sp.]|uniref:STAS domain-containing protein n=1 Tax=uncultured Rhodoblastus sp. TaxID=543037 RepID=UPI0025FFE2AF|nr:STAS domain-containing protein [uncultured Rhodoblastus sp.]
MKIVVSEDGGVVFIEPVGFIDGKTAPEFHDAVLALLKPKARTVLNMTQVDFMSSAGLRSMLLIYQQAKSKEAKIVLTGVNNDIRKSMSATGFLAFFIVAETVQDAISQLG